MSRRSREHPPVRGYGVVVRGALGVGKTTVAIALAKRLGGHVVSIDAILERHQLEEWEEGYISVGSFLRANDFALADAEIRLRRGVPVVFDGNFYHRVVIADLQERAGCPVWVYTLRAPLEACLARDRARPVSYGEEAVRAVFEKAGEVDVGKSIDAERPVGKVISQIARDLGSRGVRLPGARPARNP